MLTSNEQTNGSVVLETPTASSTLSMFEITPRSCIAQDLAIGVSEITESDCKD